MLRPGLAALFVPLTFSSLDAGLFYGGFKGGSDPPPCPGSPGLLPTCPASCGCPAGTPGWPGGGGGGSSCATHLGPPPRPPGTSGRPWHLGGVGANGRPPQRDCRHFAPRKERWETRRWDPASCTAPSPPAGTRGSPPDPRAGAASSSSAPSSSKELAEKKHFGGKGTVLGTSGCSGVRTPNQEVCTQKQPPISHYPISPMGSLS